MEKRDGTEGRSGKCGRPEAEPENWQLWHEQQNKRHKEIIYGIRQRDD
jgi:hypothetical protein